MENLTNDLSDRTAGRGSTSNELPTLKEKIMLYLKVHGRSSIQSVVLGVEGNRSYVKEKLYLLKRLGFVHDKLENEFTELGYLRITHYWWPTVEGVKWLDSLRKP